MQNKFIIPEKLKCPKDSNFHNVCNMYDEFIDKWIEELDIENEESKKQFTKRLAELIKLIYAMMEEMESVMDDPDERAKCANPEYVELEIVNLHANMARCNSLAHAVLNPGIQMDDIETQVKELVNERYKGKIILD